MRWKIGILGVFLLTVASGLWFFGVKSQENQDEKQFAKEVLQAQAQGFGQDLAALLEKVESVALGQLLGKQKVTEQNFVAGLLLKGEKELQSYFRTVNFSSAEQKALEDYYQSQKQTVDIWQDSKGRRFLIISSTVAGKDYLALVLWKDVFKSLSLGNLVRPWVANESGKILFYSNSNLINTDAQNVRPVAIGMDGAKRKVKMELFSEYSNFEGKASLGSWLTLPKWQLVVGAEWPHKELKKSASLGSLATIFGLLALGGLLIGFAITPRPVQVVEAKRELKDLSHEARTFIKRAETKAEEAYKFAEKRDRECSELEAKARDQLQYAERTRWLFEKTENFLDKGIQAPNEEEVWPILSSTLSTMALNAPVIVYTYMPTSHSLVYQADSGLQRFPENACRFLQSSRILVGDMGQIYSLEENAAYQNWYSRFMRQFFLEKDELLPLAFSSPTGTRGVALFILPEDAYSTEDLEKQKDVWQLFCYRAAWLYDLKRRLLQSKYAGRRKKNMAGPTDQNRNQPPSSNA